MKEQLAALEINRSDCRGEEYDSGANMIGWHQSFQFKILSENPRAFFVPCSAHSLKLLLVDMSLLPIAVSFFGPIQHLYTIFTSSTERWKILTTHVNDFTLKLLLVTRWES
jgi:hypothetical protein